MKKWLLLFCIVLLLTGCKSKEEKMQEAAVKLFEKRYGIEVKAQKIEKERAVGSTLIIIMAMFIPLHYYVELETLKEPKLTVKGVIFEDDYKEYDDNYIEKRHAFLMANDRDYRKLITHLNQSGFTNISLKNNYSRGANVNILFNGRYSEKGSKTESIIKDINTVFNKILGNVQYKKSVDLEVSVSKDLSENLKIDETAPGNNKSFENQLTDQLSAVKSYQRMNSAIESHLNRLGFEVELSELVTSFGDNWEIIHEIELSPHKKLNEDSLMEAIKFLNSTGFQDSYIKIFTKGNISNSCQVKDAAVMPGVSRCFSPK